jgi:hypothetical protein
VAARKRRDRSVAARAQRGLAHPSKWIRSTGRAQAKPIARARDSFRFAQAPDPATKHARTRAEARPRPGPSALWLTRCDRARRLPRRRSRLSYSQCQTAQFLRSRLVLRPGSPSSFLLRRCRPPSEGIGGAPRDVQPCTCRASDARRHACEAWALPRNREARLTALRRGVVGPAPPSRPGHDGRADAKAPRPPGIAARLRCRAFRIRGYHPRATPHPAPPSGSSPDDAPHERDVRYIV